MNNIIRILLLSLSLAITAGCGGRKTETTVSSEVKEEHHEEGESNIVGLTKEQAETAGITYGSIEEKSLTSTIKVTGKLEVPAQNKAAVTSLYSGILRTITVHPGSYVQKGQTIATITNTELSGIQQQYITVSSQLRLAELEVNRQSELVKGNAAPLKNLQRAQAELTSLRAQSKALARQLADLGVSASSVRAGNISSTIRITAPISGTISDIHAQIGSNVDATTPVARIVNNSRLHLDLFVYEKDLPAIRTGQVIHFSLTNQPGIEYDATVFSVGTAFADETKAVPVHAEVRGNKTGLIEGMNVTALISTGSKLVPTVPSEAIVSAGGKDFIFIETDKKPEEHHEEGGEHGKEEKEHTDEHQPTINFERIQVVRYTSELGFTEIQPVKEIPKGAQIVIKGSFFLMAKMTNTGEHEH